MPAVSQSQGALFRWVEHTPASQLPRKERRMKRRMTHQQLHDFAATKTKELPVRVGEPRHAHLPSAAGR